MKTLIHLILVSTALISCGKNKNVALENSHSDAVVRNGQPASKTTEELEATQPIYVSDDVLLFPSASKPGTYLYASFDLEFATNEKKKPLFSFYSDSDVGYYSFMAKLVPRIESQKAIET